MQRSKAGSNNVCDVSPHADIGIDVDSKVMNCRHWLHRGVADADWIRRNDMLTPCGCKPQELDLKSAKKLYDMTQDLRPELNTNL